MLLYPCWIHPPGICLPQRAKLRITSTTSRLEGVHSSHSGCGCVNQAFHCSQGSGLRSPAGVAAQAVCQDKVTKQGGLRGEGAAPIPAELPSKGFRQHWSPFWENWTEQCKWKCTHGVEISHPHSSPRAPLCENEEQPPHPLQSSPSSSKDQRCNANTNPFSSTWELSRAHKPALTWLGYAGGGSSSCCSHLTHFCPQDVCKAVRPWYFHW